MKPLTSSRARRNLALTLGGSAWLAAALLLWLAQDWQARTEQLQAQAQARPPLPIHAPPVPPPRVLASLPGNAHTPERLADLLELGIRQGLVSPRSEHRLSSAGGLERLRVSMPLAASYATLRGFLSEALLQDPGLSLDSLKLRRANAEASDLEIDLQWSLHSRSELRVPETKP